MQIKEFEAFSLKECLQQVRQGMGPEAVILETRKFRKGGVLGWGARDAVRIVAATGITVDEDAASHRRESTGSGKRQTSVAESKKPGPTQVASAQIPVASTTPSAAIAAARLAYARNSDHREARPAPVQNNKASKMQPRADEAEVDLIPGSRYGADRHPAERFQGERETDAAERLLRDWEISSELTGRDQKDRKSLTVNSATENERLSYLEQAMKEIRDSLSSLHAGQRESHERTVNAVVSAVTPVLSGVAQALQEENEQDLSPFQDLVDRLVEAGVSPALARELVDEIPDLGAWKEQAQRPLAEAALRSKIAHRVASAGPIHLTPGKLKAVALIGPTGVGKTTTIAKLAAHFALVENKKVALLTVDTYRIAAVEQLKTYSQIIDIPISVAYSHAEVLPALAAYADYDLLLIDTAGRSQKNIMQVGELKTLLEAVSCETQLVLSAQTKESDMLEAARRFSAARVDRLLFTKLDETSTYGTLLNVADATGIPLSYLATGQKVPEDIEIADGARLANMLLN